MRLLPIIKRTVTAIAMLVIVNSASSQRVAHFLTGSISENALVELQLVQRLNQQPKVLANYNLSPDNRNFAFVIPTDTAVVYALQVNVMKMEGRHPKLEHAYTIPLAIGPDKNYSLNLAPSKLNTAKKTGWLLKQNTNSSASLITGHVRSPLKLTMQLGLHAVENGATYSVCSVPTNTDGYFEIASPVTREGFYYLTTPRSRIRFYLKPSERLQLDIDHMTGNVISLNGSRENQAMYQWQQLIAPITSYGYNLAMVRTDSIELDQYMRKYEELTLAMAGFIDKVDRANPRFVHAFQIAMNVDRELVPLKFLLYKSAINKTHFISTPKYFGDVPEFYKQFIAADNFKTASILQVGEARDLVYLHSLLTIASLPAEEKENLSQSQKLKLMMNAISNDTLKSLLFNDQMNRIEINNLSEFKEIFEPFKSYAKFSPAKETYKNVYGQFAGDTVFIGKSSYNFSLPDTSGKIISMKDFKGKVVFVDVWATWCGPCRGQFPFLKEIEEEYADNKDLVFVGISLDKLDVKQKWIDMIRKEKLGGIQLQDDFGKSFGRKYEVAAIPRFMLIDRQGRWIEIRCPRPESKEDLKKYLDNALKQLKT